MASVQERVKEMYEAHPFPRCADPFNPEWIERSQRYFYYLSAISITSARLPNASRTQSFLMPVVEPERNPCIWRALALAK